MMEVPPAYTCTASRTVMNDPVLNLCGHLFDNSALGTTPLCPVDQKPIDAAKCIPFAELKKAIEVWKSQQVGTHEIKPSYSSIIRGVSGHSGSSSSASSVPVAPDEQMSRLRLHGITPLKVIRNAHMDDIHGFVATREGFMSGSKDGTLKIWDNEGEFIRYNGSENASGYKFWITALGRFSNDFVASGSRDGLISIWNETGEAIRNIEYNPARKDHVCKDRNKLRINCITELETTDETTIFYTGTPGYVQVWDAEKRSFLKGYWASKNDWVYCIDVLGRNHLSVVIGSDLEIWDISKKIPNKVQLVTESPEECFRNQRPHIAATKRLEHNRDILSGAFFDGSVRLVDLVSQKTTGVYREHKGRVWSIENISPHLLASCADDREIKVWDVRLDKSIVTIGGNPGRVSSLLRLNENVLISGSCPDKVFESEEKAGIYFWDIRQLSARV